MLDLTRYEIIDWDDPETNASVETNNLLHCQQADHLGSQAELIVYEVFSGYWAEIQFKTSSAQYTVVGVAISSIWLLLLSDSHKRSDWLRPITGWPAEGAEVRAWEKATGQTWKGKR
ncbi:MAG: hypothetical protein WAK71_25960 [Streptosporangiaceae bacterium]